MFVIRSTSHHSIQNTQLTGILLLKLLDFFVQSLQCPRMLLLKEGYGGLSIPQFQSSLSEHGCILEKKTLVHNLARPGLLTIGTSLADE